ncbi:hypothetical protein VPHD478_0011 [Vibrio phage D478]
MAENLVSQPPLNTQVVSKDGYPTRAFSIWMRDIYNRVAYKGGNAIDENKAETDQNILDLNSSLEETIEKVNENSTGISDNKQGIEDNAENLSNHESLEEAHGSNGNIVGFNDLAEEAVAGLVKRMGSINDAIQTTVNITTSDIGAAPAAYDQSYTQSVTDLTNENKAAVNQLASDLNDAIAVLNNLLAESKSSGQMTTP